jgi:hypothetical protein
MSSSGASLFVLLRALDRLLCRNNRAVLCVACRASLCRVYRERWGVVAVAEYTAEDPNMRAWHYQVPAAAAPPFATHRPWKKNR